jgi:hypothetical protein
MTLRAVANVPNYLGSFTYATLPSASANSGLTARASDVGLAPGMLLVSDGTQWRPDGPRVLFRCAVPVGIAPTGTMANNGAVTLGTALDIIYSTGLYLYYPASAIVSGSAAGYYWTVMSSTTVGTVYNNTYATGTQPTVPASPTAFSTTGPGAFTGVTTSQDALSATVPGNLLGTNGQLRIHYTEAHNNTAGTKTVVVQYGGTSFFTGTETATTTGNEMFRISNRGVANAQVQAAGSAATIFGVTSTTQGTGSVDSTQSQTVVHQLRHSGAATDWTILQDVLIEVLP